MKQNIVFFDGHCNLCNKTVDILIRVDGHSKLYFAPLSGKTAKEVRLKADHPSIVYFRNPQQIYVESDAIIEICADILPLGSVLKIFKWVPRFIRDSLYQLIAKNRYTLFGRRDTCRLPTSQERARFLD